MQRSSTSGGHSPNSLPSATAEWSVENIKFLRVQIWNKNSPGITRRGRISRGGLSPRQRAQDLLQRCIWEPLDVVHLSGVLQGPFVGPKQRMQRMTGELRGSPDCPRTLPKLLQEQITNPQHTLTLSSQTLGTAECFWTYKGRSSRLHQLEHSHQSHCLMKFWWPYLDIFPHSHLN